MTRFTARTLTTAIAVSASLIACSNDGDSSPGGGTETPGEGEGKLDDDAIHDIEALADDLIAKGVPGVSIVMMRGEQTVKIVRGVADRETGAPLTPDHRFRVASIAKSMLASVVLQLVDEGKLNLEDTLEQWLPGAVSANGNVTIEQLLRQQSGLFDYGADPRLMAPYMAGDFEHHWAPNELLQLSNDHPPNFAPGARYEYSNTNFTLVALIIEKITGAPLADVVRERIVKPLGLSSTTLETGSDMKAPYAHGYFLGLGDAPVDVTPLSASAVFGSGNVVSTPLDLARFYRALLRGEVVSERQLPEMLTIDTSIPKAHYAMGLFRFENMALYPCGTFIGHDGGIPGYDTVAYSSLDGKRQFAVVVNSFTLQETAGDERAQAAFAALNGAVACR